MAANQGCKHEIYIAFYDLSRSMSQICGHFIHLVFFSPKMRGLGSKLSLKMKSKPELGAEQLKCSGVQSPRHVPGHLLFSSMDIPRDTYSSFCRASLGRNVEGAIDSENTGFKKFHHKLQESWFSMFSKSNIKLHLR